MEHFSCKTKILSGEGAVSELGKLEIKRLLLVTDPFFYENGTAAQVADMAKAEAVEVFHRVQPDPTVELAAEGTLAVRAFQPDTIVALGGGSAMDCAKAMRFFAGGEIRLIAIPTTSGSGSEVTDFAVLTEGGVKHPLVDEKTRPDIAILDSGLLTRLPPGLVADSGFDVLSHAVEAYVATGAGAVTDALAQSSFVTAFHQLEASFKGDRSVRLSIHNAATMAGLAFTQAGLGLVHAMAHSLGGAFHLPHGRLNAILLPSVISRNGCRSKYAALARAAGLGGTADTIAVRELKNGLIKLRRELGLPATLAQAGIAPGRVQNAREALVRAALEDPCCKTNPVPVTEAMALEILDEVTGHG